MKSHCVVSGNPGEGLHETDSGAYQLIFRLARQSDIAVGALGLHTFACGAYLYTGRALRWLNKRIERHLRKEKRLRRHIDYLLEQAQMEGIRLYPDRAADECSINNHTASVLGVILPVKGFGSADCRCTSHLMRIPETVTVDLDVVMKNRRRQD